MSGYRASSTISNESAPIVKWAGGKRQILQELTGRMPIEYNRYYEPFVGGGAMFFELAPDNAYISDINSELINLYKVVKSNVEGLIKDLASHENSLEYFIRLRALDRSEEYFKLDDIRRASRFIYLNKTCFNGLYRVNSKGHFNVPYGYYSNPNIINAKSLLAAARSLKTAQIENAGFEGILKLVKPNDFVYFDPPYIPLSATSSFTSYSKDNFGKDDHLRLKKLCDILDSIGVMFMLSNSDTPLSNELYQKYRVEKILACRNINSKGDGRGKISEIIVTNY